MFLNGTNTLQSSLKYSELLTEIWWLMVIDGLDGRLKAKTQLDAHDKATLHP